MERKIIIGMLVSILAVVSVIFCAKRITSADTPTNSKTDPPPSIETSATTTTDLWDYLHGQSETTTTTTATDENGNPVTTSAATDENGDPVTTSAATDENGEPIVTEATTTAETETTTTTTTTAPHLVFPG